MRLAQENAKERDLVSQQDLTTALAAVGTEDNGFAILVSADEFYMQTSGSWSEGFIIEYRDGSEERHFASVRTDIPHAEMVEMFVAYYQGNDSWKSRQQWNLLDL